MILNKSRLGKKKKKTKPQNDLFGKLMAGQLIFFLNAYCKVLKFLKLHTCIKPDIQFLKKDNLESLKLQQSKCTYSEYKTGRNFRFVFVQFIK